MRRILGRYIGNFVWNIALVYVCYFVCRVMFVLDNWDSFGYLTMGDFITLCRGGLLFDSAAIAYTNALYMLLVFFPLHLKEREGYYKVVKGLFVGVNLLMLGANLVDSGYFPFSNQRATTSVFAQFAGEDNLLGIFLIEAVRSWYLVVAFAVMAYGLWRGYRTPRYEPRHGVGYYATSLAALAVFAFAALTGMRGGMGKAIRPITLSNANHFTKRPAEASVVLNTPFSFIRTIGQEHFTVPVYFTEREPMLALYNALHTPTGDEVFTPMNVVQIILERTLRSTMGEDSLPSWTRCGARASRLSTLLPMDASASMLWRRCSAAYPAWGNRSCSLHRH